MSSYTIEQWTIQEVATAFKEKDVNTDNKRIIIPIFQRGLRWEPERRATFIDSINKGYPFGALLFAKHEKNTYSVVDGLQRGSTVCEYVFNPLSTTNFEKIDDDTLTSIRQVLFPGNLNKRINDDINEIIVNYFDKCKSYDQAQTTTFTLAREIISVFPTQEDDLSCIASIIEILGNLLNTRKKKYSRICSAIVPIVVYSGRNELLPIIFHRINKKGIALNDYEIYAAIWDQSKKVINNTRVVENVIQKYVSIASQDYTIDDFDATKMLSEKQLTAFEFLFGVGKYWNERYSCLHFYNKQDENKVNEISFEIFDACINDTKDIDNLDKTVYKQNPNKILNKIETAIEFVSESIANISLFKGNKRKPILLHSKYQIISLISFTFKQMYDFNNLSKFRPDWEENKESYRKNIIAHYVADILDNEWHEGGQGKVYSANNNKKYLETISKERMSQLLSHHYQTQLSNKQLSRFAKPSNADRVILNCIYVNLFTANDQLSYNNFDIEHLATREKMKRIIDIFPNHPMPVSCIANLCYLPEKINRGKKEKTIYEVRKLSIPISEIENKYSFTTESDLNWILKDYSKEDESEFDTDYYSFLQNRYETISDKFLSFFR